MKKSLLFLLLSGFLITSCSHKRDGKPRILVFSKTAGFKHASIPVGIAAIQKLGSENGFEVDTTKSAERFTEAELKKYSAVIFLSTTGNVLDYRQEAAFERYIQAGGGFVGIHAATDTEYDWGWYGRLVGAYFNGHPKTQPARFVIKDKSFKATDFFTDTVWQHTDELYNFKKVNPATHVLITIDETSYEGGTNGSFHPISWYQDYDGGRSFYTELGHTDEAYSEEKFLKHLLGGIQYAIGDNLELNYSNAKSQFPPEEDRFTKTQLVQGEFFEPTEMTILPNFDVLVVQRRGEIMHYKSETKTVKQVGYLNVYWKTLHTPRVNAEEGLMGIAKDPDFAKNNWIYLYYSPVDSSVNRLSRFTFQRDTVDVTTEKVILEVKAQREICCHTGGSVAFGPDGLLYLSTGDNSTPFNEPGAPYVNSGFGPLNDLPGRQQYDARRSSGNTNDLRGKILRIKVKDDGTYEIPEGNLFPKDTEKARAEIYVMGNRNPYRISVDQKNSNLYWGEVGPDAPTDSLDTRGPRGYDELNQARKAGYFGWPQFVGNNYPYRQYDYATGKSGAAFDPLKPINDSKNNTGLRELPPIAPAFIWYPYGFSQDFPQVGSGGRNAMAGPVYYTDMFPKETRLPDYYNGKLIMYEWIRNWMKAVTMLPNGDFDKMEPFFPGIKLNAAIDMEVGTDGRIYLLEYGNGWFKKNPDAGLSRIDYNYGNRPPKITSLTIDKTTGVLPLAIKATIVASDPEKDNITYLWNLGNGTTKETTAPELTYTYAEVGDFTISVEAKDNQGASSKSDPIAIYAGNEIPSVNIQLSSDNQSFFLPGQPLKYSVEVKDNDAAIDVANLFVSVDYVAANKAAILGHQQAAISGKNLTLSLDCKSCHKENEKSIGPSFVQVAQKYQKDANATNYLSEKIITGGGGVWGEVSMAAHPTVSKDDIQQMVGYILSLAKEADTRKSLSATGTIVPPADQKPGTVLVLSASYTDKGGNNAKALTGSKSISLPGSMIAFTGKESVNRFIPSRSFGGNQLTYPTGEGWFAFTAIDFTGVRSVSIISEWAKNTEPRFDMELRLDAVDGRLIGKGTIAAPKKGEHQSISRFALEAVKDSALHKVYFISKTQNSKGKIETKVSAVQFGAK